MKVIARCEACGCSGVLYESSELTHAAHGVNATQKAWRAAEKHRVETGHEVLISKVSE